jgi:hypothetical protein
MKKECNKKTQQHNKTFNELSILLLLKTQQEPGGRSDGASPSLEAVAPTSCPFSRLVQKVAKL